jgi:hypothetical protein
VPVMLLRSNSVFKTMGIGFKTMGRWRSVHANYLIIYKKSSRNGRFLVVNSRALNIPFWVQNNRCKDSFWGQKERVKTILGPILNSVAVIMVGYRGPTPSDAATKFLGVICASI